MTLKQKFRQIKKFPNWIWWLPARILSCWKALMRVEIIDPNDYIGYYCSNPNEICVCAVWHNRLLFFPALFPKTVRSRTYAVISASRDGQYIADLAAQFGVKSVRGSSRKGAAKVLLDAVRSIRGGGLIAFTPDGPRGPRYAMSRGPVHLASTQRCPFIPIGINYSAYWSLKSWDAFQIPKPWAKITLIIGDKIETPEHLDESQMEEQRLRFEKALNQVSMVEAGTNAKGKEKDS